MLFVKLISLLVCLFSLSFLVHAELSLDSYSFNNYYPAQLLIEQDDKDWLILDQSETPSYKKPLLVVKSLDQIELDSHLSLITQDTPALAYPNPFKLKNGVDIGFFSSESYEAELLVYDMLGHLRIQKDISVINSSYNIIHLSRQDFQGGSVSSGAYFYVLVRGSDVVREGKMGVIP